MAGSSSLFRFLLSTFFAVSWTATPSPNTQTHLPWNTSLLNLRQVLVFVFTMRVPLQQRAHLADRALCWISGAKSAGPQEGACLHGLDESLICHRVNREALLLPVHSKGGDMEGKTP